MVVTFHFYGHFAGLVSKLKVYMVGSMQTNRVEGRISNDQMIKS